MMNEATVIGSPPFTCSVAKDPRRQGWDLAVAKAKSEAETIASAAEGTIGGMIEPRALPTTTFVRRR